MRCVTAKFLDTDNIDVEIRATMSLGDWKRVKAKLGDLGGGGWSLWMQITKAISAVEAQVVIEDEK